MRIKCTSFDDMADDIISNNLQIVIFGCGVIGRITSLQILKQYHLQNHLQAYVDNDSRIWGNWVDDTEVHVPIYNPDEFFNKNVKDNIVVFVGASRYRQILDQLENYESIKDAECYLIPIMCLHNYKQIGNDGVVKDYKEPVIPKKIHYIWLGKKELPYNLKMCIKSWKRFCPDYEIIRWDESNYDFYSVPYMREAMENNAFGFAPDYARLDIIYKYGGFYLDTDVEMIRPLDDLRYQDAFCGVETWQTVNAGGCFGAVPGNDMVHDMIENREGLHYVYPDGSVNMATCGYYDTMVLIKNGYKMTGEVQKVGDMTVYPKEFFHPYDYMSGKTDITSNTFSVHRFKGGWMTPEMHKQNKRTQEKFDEFYESIMNNN